MLNIVDVLCCPRCHSDIAGASSAQALSCSTCQARFPIIQGIPCLLPQHFDSYTQEAFEREWGELKEEDERAWAVEVKDRIPQIVDFLGFRSPEQLQGRRILDVGCGDGSLTDMMARAFQADVVGADLTRGMMRTQRKPDKQSIFVQGDACCLPFKNESFDIVWSGGVLMMTPDTQAAFAGLPRLLRPGGRVGVWLYGKDRPLRELIMPNVRGLGREYVFKRVSRKGQDFMIDALARLAMIKQRMGLALGTRRRLPCSLNEKKMKLRDSLSVNYARFHSRAEVTGWFEAAGLRNINCRMIDGAVVCYGDR